MAKKNIKKKEIAIIGGGSAGIFLAGFLDSDKFQVTIYEQNKSVARKFLVAGKGGFNLTHSEDRASLLTRYTPTSFLQDSIESFDNQAFRQWLESIGISTFIGTSKRVYPQKGIKPIQVLDAILAHLEKNQVNIATEHRWTAWSAPLQFSFNNSKHIEADYVIFALGGSSWSVTGSNGHWTSLFEEKKILTLPFESSNCAFHLNWDKEFIQQHEGKPIKNIKLSCDQQIASGELIVTQSGLEGNAIYALSPSIRAALNIDDRATIHMDLKPLLDEQTIVERLQSKLGKGISKVLRENINLGKTKLALLKSLTSKSDFMDMKLLAKKIKALPIELTQSGPIEKAISTVGGIHRESLSKYFELKEHQNHFCIGEMVDWDAPTGGYLLQGCVSMAYFLAEHLNSK